MEMVRHNVLGLGEVVRREVIDGFTYIWVRYENGTEMKLAIPYSFTAGAVEALGELKDEVDGVIAEKMEKLSASTSSKTPTTPKTPAPTRKESFARHTPSSPIAAAYEKYLIAEGYRLVGISGKRSTVGQYVDSVENVLTQEGISWDTLKGDIENIVSKYDEGGTMSWFGAKGNCTVINALKRFAEFVGKP